MAQTKQADAANSRHTKDPGGKSRPNPGAEPKKQQLVPVTSSTNEVQDKDATTVPGEGSTNPDAAGTSAPAGELVTDNTAPGVTAEPSGGQVMAKPPAPESPNKPEPALGKMARQRLGNHRAANQPTKPPPAVTAQTASEPSGQEVEPPAHAPAQPEAPAPLPQAAEPVPLPVGNEADALQQPQDQEGPVALQPETGLEPTSTTESPPASGEPPQQPPGGAAPEPELGEEPAQVPAERQPKEPAAQAGQQQQEEKEKEVKEETIKQGEEEQPSQTAGAGDQRENQEERQEQQPETNATAASKLGTKAEIAAPEGDPGLGLSNNPGAAPAAEPGPSAPPAGDSSAVSAAPLDAESSSRAVDEPGPAAEREPLAGAGVETQPEAEASQGAGASSADVEPQPGPQPAEEDAGLPEPTQAPEPAPEASSYEAEADEQPLQYKSEAQPHYDIEAQPGLSQDDEAQSSQGQEGQPGYTAGGEPQEQSYYESGAGNPDEVEAQVAEAGASEQELYDDGGSAVGYPEGAAANAGVGAALELDPQERIQEQYGNADLSQGQEHVRQEQYFGEASPPPQELQQQRVMEPGYSVEEQGPSGQQYGAFSPQYPDVDTAEVRGDGGGGGEEEEEEGEEGVETAGGGEEAAAVGSYTAQEAYDNGQGYGSAGYAEPYGIGEGYGAEAELYSGWQQSQVARSDDVGQLTGAASLRVPSAMAARGGSCGDESAAARDAAALLAEERERFSQQLQLEARAREELEDMILRIEKHFKAEQAARMKAEELLQASIAAELESKNRLEDMMKKRMEEQQQMEEERNGIKRERNALESMRQEFEAELQAARSEVAKAQDALAASEDRIRAAEALDRARLESEYQARINTLQEEVGRLREELSYRTQMMAQEMARWQQQAHLTAAAVMEAKNEVLERKRELDSTKEKMDRLLDKLYIGRERNIELSGAIAAAQSFAQQHAGGLASVAGLMPPPPLLMPPPQQQHHSHPHQQQQQPAGGRGGGLGGMMPFGLPGGMMPMIPPGGLMLGLPGLPPLPGGMPPLPGGMPPGGHGGANHSNIPKLPPVNGRLAGDGLGPPLSDGQGHRRSRQGMEGGGGRSGSGSGGTASVVGGIMPGLLPGLPGLMGSPPTGLGGGMGVGAMGPQGGSHGASPPQGGSSPRGPGGSVGYGSGAGSPDAVDPYAHVQSRFTQPYEAAAAKAEAARKGRAANARGGPRKPLDRFEESKRDEARLAAMAKRWG